MTSLNIKAGQQTQIIIGGESGEHVTTKEEHEALVAVDRAISGYDLPDRLMPTKREDGESFLSWHQSKKKPGRRRGA